MARDVPRIPIQLSREVLVASVQVDLDDATFAGLRDDLLARVHASGATGVILDLSGLDTLDAHEFEALRGLISMTRVMGARAVMVGLKPGIVAALMMTDVDIDGIEAAIDLDDAFRMLEPAEPPATDLEPDGGEDGDDDGDPGNEADGTQTAGEADGAPTAEGPA